MSRTIDEPISGNAVAAESQKPKTRSRVSTLSGNVDAVQGTALDHDHLLDELRSVDSSRDAVSITIARKLLDYLLRGNFRPGDRLPSERKLAEVLGVGRSAVEDLLPAGKRDRTRVRGSRQLLRKDSLDGSVIS